MRSVIIAFLYFSLIVGRVDAHPLHVSIINMDINKDSNFINYSIRLFYDDFQMLINSKYNTSIDFNKEKRLSVKEQRYVVDYLNSSFIVVDNTLSYLKPVFLRWNIENMSVWFYFGMNFTVNANHLTIENKLMDSLFTDQKNMLIVNDGSKEQAYEFNLRKTKQEVDLF